MENYLESKPFFDSQRQQLFSNKDIYEKLLQYSNGKNNAFIESVNGELAAYMKFEKPIFRNRFD